ncbi:hypothetical protein COCMIDRAFT_101171 [Bipolaris oryzae ATCC 44560]|uniref:Uncharacterized protein n=1 Tax=Bipolaris oryzae ATCC 44560 TaxID=930090 RepID=W6Z0U2_COCMI|nr:uncharacterized protein COCMIDRAFT_101171 [Bipolaris oryzae ATCC 44560]EUC43298.1 hypothetical protein COCMIDRAFT_101171 [Bipolaris oryzae ATCC 44560]
MLHVLKDPKRSMTTASQSSPRNCKRLCTHAHTHTHTRYHCGVQNSLGRT